ncbi:MAG TPA: SMC family ATPase [Nocardioides sp.]|uniref:SMC family ATPase n=1 Tax=Nocardioides sp. TaxID=35761 RepID=UPI002D806958|nr:SMC family ATPase [Nocardioides sp.]HET6651947.1 SMC family ATPase [Nocardioides sp.]
MRLHDLTVTAFGPFAGTEQVDFDTLNDAGLFLLSGATGAGKTSILDAVCFALYGQVPGVRGVKTLKSQHSPDDLRPEVVLYFSVRDRRFVVRRSPEWTRPKRRGEGVATEKASASLVEICGDGEHFLSSRAAEVGLMVSDLVGMQAAQFQQVAMLPQGEFQRFLQASSQDRHDVLQRLFHTDRFSRIEEWVHEHSRRRREDAEAGRSTTQRLIDGIADRGGVEVPARLVPETLAAAAAAGEVQPWLAEVLRAVVASATTAAAAHTSATEAAEAARAALADGRRAWSAWQRRAAAQQRLAELEADTEAADLVAAALDADRRAAACLPVLAVLDRARREGDAARSTRESTAATAGARVLPAPEDPGEWGPVVAAARDRLARVEALLPVLHEVTAARRSEHDAAAALAAATAAADAAATTHAALPDRLGEARAELDGARAESARGEALGLQLTSARQRGRAAAELPAAEQALLDLQDAARSARDAAADARDLVQDLQQRRLDGIAGELAGRLVDGESCLVCGGTEHPSPAATHDDAVTDQEQDAAAEAHDLAQRAHADLVARVADAQRQVASLRELAAGRDAESWAIDVEAITSALADSERAGDRATELETTVADLERQLVAAEQSARALDVRRAELAETLRTCTARLQAAEAAVEDACRRDDLTEEDLPALVSGARDDLSAAEAAHDAAQAHAALAARLTELEQQALDTAFDHGFADLEEVRSAVLPEDDSRRLDQHVAERAAALAEVRAVLADEEVAAVGAAPPVPVVELERAAASAERAAQAAARDFHVAEQRETSVRVLATRLVDAMADWAPTRDDYVLAESMSRLVRGMGSDNHLQLRLSSYVLATRLDQVLEAANERLSHMRDQRYLLQRTGRATRRGSQAGLGLEVVDQWTGDVRDPATLSGGETFVVSLSLALGLADVVTHEAGGTEIETLFVDEGFGMLDADTLDDVMDRLDGLRAGGRTVGVVSHVTELRSRIPTQVHVRKTPSGSSIRTRTLVG